MKQHQPGLANNRFFELLLQCGSLVIFILMFGSCRNDIQKINALTKEQHLPVQSGKNIEVQFTDSGKLKLKFKAPLMFRYLNKEKGSYYDFPGGIDVLFYDYYERPESRITAGYAKYQEDKMLWEAGDSVVAKNLQTHEQLNTEQIFWNQETKMVYSRVFTKITNDDGEFYGERGFQATQDLNNYKLIGSRGTVNVEDEEFE